VGAELSDNPSGQDARNRGRWSWLILFASSTTLVCCALPILLVTVGLGAVSAAMFASFPFLGVMALHKFWLFLGSGLMLSLGAWSLYRPGRTCPADPELARQCERADKWNKRIIWFSAAIWLIGFAGAYLSLPMMEYYDEYFAG